jgi:nucleotide-binding universal stress UspA family protein
MSFLIVCLLTPWKEIMRSAREWPADVIVVGTHGRSGVDRAALTRLLPDVPSA